MSLASDFVQGFQLENAPIRGRLVRLGPVLDEILTRHAYPLPVAQLLAETVALTAALAAALKYEGVFTLQTRGDGPVRMMVADVSSDGKIRATAQFDAALVEQIAGAGWTGVALLGKGHLAFTVDQGGDTERYQGLVELRGKNLSECVQYYFQQSEQLPTALMVGAEQQDGHWRAGALMVQKMPTAQKGIPANDDDADGWDHARAVTATCSLAELLGGDVTAPGLIYRLFHEFGVRVFDPTAFAFQCRCSRERVETVLKSMSWDDVQHMKIDGVVTATCDFCSTSYRFDDADLSLIVSDT
jgi:molecular chaperone Hsp33